MTEQEKLKILPRTMINLSRHEDDEPFYAEKELIGIIVARHLPDAIEVVIPVIDPDRTFFIHQAEVPKK